VSTKLFSLAAAFLASGALLALIQFAGPDIVDYDGYYHIKMASLIREKGLPTPFPYLPLTILDEKGYTDHHFLLHVIQIPFTYLKDLRLAAKLSAVFCAALAFTAFFWLLRSYSVPYPWLWLLMLFASSSAFLYRMSMPRAQSLSLALQIIASHLILQRKYKALAVLSMIFVWTYNAFPTVCALVFIGVVTFLITERRFEYKLLVAGAAGIAAGLVINPYFPQDILFLWNHIVPKIFAFKYQTNVGSEWYPYNSWVLFSLAPVAILSYMGGILWTNREEWKMDAPKLFWFLAASLYLYLVVKSRRFVEYFPPSAILFLAFALRHELKEFRFKHALQVRKRQAVLLGVMACLATMLGLNIAHVSQDIRESPDTYAYKGAAEWLAQNTPQGSIVFTTDWDDFPMLFYYNTHNRYIVGLDADFMRLKNEPLFREYEKITRGQVNEPADEILTDFNARFVFTDLKHKDFMHKADNDFRFVKQYSDSKTAVYEIIPTE
jgi:hypothetical protein